jgi:hypothetical protein
VGIKPSRKRIPTHNPTHNSCGLVRLTGSLAAPALSEVVVKPNAATLSQQRPQVRVPSSTPFFSVSWKERASKLPPQFYPHLFSDQRNCQTSGPLLRLIRFRLPCCIVVLLHRGCGEEESSGIQDEWRRGGRMSRVNCFAAAVVFAETSLSVTNHPVASNADSSRKPRETGLPMQRFLSPRRAQSCTSAQPRFATACRSIDPPILFVFVVLLADRVFSCRHGLGDGLSDFFVV